MKKSRKSPRTHATRAAPAPAAGFAPVPTRRRANGWTPERQLDFLEALAASGCVTEACAAVNISPQSAYRLRTRIDAQGFRIAWDAAIDLGIRRLTDACLSRAIHGEAVPHFYQGEQIGEHRRYDNRLAMFLMRYRDPLRYAASLDQMVYTGDPERAALAFARARDRAADDAYGIDPGPPAADDADPAAPPWTSTTIGETLDAARERAIVAGDAPISGSHERRSRLAAMRARHHASLPPEEDDATVYARIRAARERVDHELAAAAGNDTASLSSLSEADPAPARPPPNDPRPLVTPF